jgi:uncharacterized lipoprotein YddW (UPF0748 family)
MLARMKIRFVLLSLCILPAVLFAGARVPQLPEVRAIWVTRFDYKSSADVAAIVANCAKAGFTDIFFQVRGNGTVYYPSRVEPWAFELSGRDVSNVGKNPGWDPLLTAASWAKRYQIRLHAYINVLPGWRGKASPPGSAGQLWTAHPDWFMVDSTGAKMLPPNGWYSFLNPAHPGVRNHLSQIAAELARYDIAGIHLDYIRFPYDYKDEIRQIYPHATDAEKKAHCTFSFDPISRRMMGNSTSRKAWDKFRRDSVTQVVRDLKASFSRSRQNMPSILSSSVLADFNDGYNAAFQDSSNWVKEGAVNWLVPMNYSASKYDERLAEIKHSLGRKRTATQLVMGIHCDGAVDAQEIRRQIAVARKAGCRGFALFSYSHLFANHQPTAKARVLMQ